MATRNITYGNDFFKTLEKPDSDCSFEITYWDLWIVIILDKQFDNKWDDLVNHLYNNHTHFYKGNCESIVAQILYLRNGLFEKGFNPSDILFDLDDDFLKKQTIKAKRKVIDLNFQEKEKSHWMQFTPRNMHFAEALYGSWDIFPINPEDQLKELRKKFKKKTGYSKNQTFALEEKLSTYIEKNEKKATIPKLFALYRAFLSVILEYIDSIDSYGVIGELTISIFEKYLQLDWRELPIDAEGYFTDIARYVIWEDYGLTGEIYPSMFDGLRKSEIKAVELLLQTDRKKLIENRLTYSAEKALTLLGNLYARNNPFASACG